MDVYLKEYSSEDAIRKYISNTAGYGINHLLEHEYADIYQSVITEYLDLPKRTGLRLLEFGCGAGMNLVALYSLLQKKGAKIDLAIGTDFSEPLIDAARLEIVPRRNGSQSEPLKFVVARNEQLMSDLSRNLQVAPAKLLASFHLILGVNTFRYCHRLGKTAECARDIADLLAPGGICIVIDMNRRFPAFRSKLRFNDKSSKAERYLPSLNEYAAPFVGAGLEILRKENFCWIPHSAGPALTRVCQALTPVLNRVAKPLAMRSLVISRKPTKSVVL